MKCGVSGIDMGVSGINMGSNGPLNVQKTFDELRRESREDVRCYIRIF